MTQTCALTYDLPLRGKGFFYLIKFESQEANAENSTTFLQGVLF